jgi:hypothetical protein
VVDEEVVAGALATCYVYMRGQGELRRDSALPFSSSLSASACCSDHLTLGDMPTHVASNLQNSPDALNNPTVSLTEMPGD